MMASTSRLGYGGSVELSSQIRHAIAAPSRCHRHASRPRWNNPNNCSIRIITQGYRLGIPDNYPNDMKQYAGENAFCNATLPVFEHIPKAGERCFVMQSRALWCPLHAARSLCNKCNTVIDLTWHWSYDVAVHLGTQLRLTRGSYLGDFRIL